MSANMSCVCEKCGYKENREGIVVGVLFNTCFKYVLSRAPCICPGCHDEFSETAFFGSVPEATEAMRKAMDKLGRAQYDKVLAAEPLSALIPILAAKYDYPEDMVYKSNTLNS